MVLSFLKVIAWMVLIALCGCGTVPHGGSTPESATVAPSRANGSDPATRNNALALLYELLNDEKNLSKLLIIKRESVELKQLVKDISKTTGAGAKRLKSIGKIQKIQLENTSLPPGEQATRKAISKTKQHILLQSKNTNFEVQLLLTQVEALNYGSHLAFVAAENEPQPQIAQQFSELSAQLKQLQARVMAMLAVKSSKLG